MKRSMLWAAVLLFLLVLSGCELGQRSASSGPPQGGGVDRRQVALLTGNLDPLTCSAVRVGKLSACTVKVDGVSVASSLAPNGYLAFDASGGQAVGVVCTYDQSHSASAGFGTLTISGTGVAPLNGGVISLDWVCAMSAGAPVSRTLAPGDLSCTCLLGSCSTPIATGDPCMADGGSAPSAPDAGPVVDAGQPVPSCTLSAAEVYDPVARLALTATISAGALTTHLYRSNSATTPWYYHEITFKAGPQIVGFQKNWNSYAWINPTQSVSFTKDLTVLNLGVGTFDVSAVATTTTSSGAISGSYQSPVIYLNCI